MPGLLEAQAQARPHHPALLTGLGPQAQPVSYARLQSLALGLVCSLQQAGVEPHDVVAVLGPHDWRFAAAVHAAVSAGAVVAPLPAGGPASALAGRLTRAKAQYCVSLPGVDVEAQAAVQRALGRPCLVWRPAIFDEQAAPDQQRPAAHADRARPPRQAAQSDPVLVLETSGTSGVPSSVTLCWQQIAAQSVGSAARLGHSIFDVWLDVLPLHHVGGLMILFRALMFGATVCVPGRFDAAEVARALGEGTIHLLSLVPTMLQRLLPLLPESGCSPKVRAVLLGGAPTPQPLFDAALAQGVPAALTWGMTEAASGVCVAWPGQKGNTRNAGPPITTAQVWADADAVLHVHGPTVGGTFKTSDRGCVQPDGTVEIWGRADRVIISGGENIAPEQVEAVLLSHRHIVDAAVVGRKDAVWGERPEAHLVATQSPVPKAELVAFCRARLASYQVPTRFVWHAQLPRDVLGKLQRATLMDEGGEDVG